LISYILNIKPSLKPLSETKLSVDNFWKSDFYPSEQAYEMCVDVYENIEHNLFEKPARIIIIGEEFYEGVLENYSFEELLQGVKIDSLISVIISNSLNKEIIFEEEVRVIAHNILEAKNSFEFESDFVSHIQKEIMSLRNKFKIMPK
jgi:hypothetical protein